MSRHGVPIGRIYGISIDLDFSWFFIVALLAWMLADSYFPAQFGGWSPETYWLVGIATAILLFVSVLIHELAHSLVAQHYGIPVPRITLFLFGGVSQIAAEPPAPASEFWIAVVGPATSFVLAVFFWEIEPFFTTIQPLYALVEYLALLNLILAIFNLIPGFPLDGGRIFRALVWRITQNYHRATIAAGLSGRFVGFLMIFFGVWQALTGDLGGGIWIAIIGWFLESAANGHLQQETVRNLLGGHVVMDAMQRNFVQVPGTVSLQEAVDQAMLPARSRVAMVTSSGSAVGMLTMSSIRDVPREDWPATPAMRVMVPLDRLTTTQPNTMLWSALEKMGRDGVNQMPVVDGAGVVGMLSREDILHYLTGLRGLAA